MKTKQEKYNRVSGIWGCGHEHEIEYETGWPNARRNAKNEMKKLDCPKCRAMEYAGKKST